MNGSALPQAASRGARAAGAVVTLLLALPAAAVGQGGQVDGDPVAATPRARADYRIEARLDPAARALSGRQWLTYLHGGPEATGELRFHLYWNAWRNSRSSWMLEDRMRRRSEHRDRPIAAGDWSYLEIESARLIGATGGEGEAAAADLLPSLRYAAPDDGNPDDRTVVVLDLPRPLLPGEAATVEMEWRARIPRTFARTGYRGDFYFLAHWFPKLGVFEPGGWNCHQYHAATEYYADYGSYDVALTVPAGWVVGATGREVAADDNGDGTATHRYRQDDVHDFAWTTSPSYVVLEESFSEPDLPPVEMRLLLQPEHRRQARRHFAATRAALASYGRWFGAYPYGHLTIVDPAYESGADGMEYPTLFTAGTRLFNPFGGGAPEGVTVHEAGHQFWYGLVGNNEFEHAWIDEGLNTYSTARVMDQEWGDRLYVKRYFSPPGTDLGGFFPLLFPHLKRDRWVGGSRMARYRRSATADDSSDPTWRFYPPTAAGITYSKTALWLGTLERHLGWETLRRVLATLFERSRLRHADPEDLFAAAEEVSGQELDWFFDQVHRSSAAFDYAVRSVASFPAAVEGLEDGDGEPAYRPPLADDGSPAALYRTEVVVQRKESGVFPVEILLVFEDGSELREAWDGRSRWRLVTAERPAKLLYAAVDPEHVLLLDLYRTNNSRRLDSAATLPALKWGSRWMIWLQDLLLSFGFFV